MTLHYILRIIFVFNCVFIYTRYFTTVTELYKNHKIKIM